MSREERDCEGREREKRACLRRKDVCLDDYNYNYNITLTLTVYMLSLHTQSHHSSFLFPPHKSPTLTCKPNARHTISNILLLVSNIPTPPSHPHHTTRPA